VYDRDYVVGGALVVAGLVNNAFLWVFDRDSECLVQDRSRILPPGSIYGGKAPLDEMGVRWPLESCSVNPTRDRTDVQFNLGTLDVDLRIRTDESLPATAVCPTPIGRNITQKTVNGIVNGRLSFGERTHTFRDAEGMLDYTRGLLPRETSWKWAIGSGRAKDGTPIGFNVVKEFNEELENVLWRDGEPYRLPSTELSLPGADGTGTGRLRSRDSRIDLEFTPLGARSESIDLGLIASDYHQPIGLWSGTLAEMEINGIVGVCEDHYSKW
jgi:hypothetical protein